MSVQQSVMVVRNALIDELNNNNGSLIEIMDAGRLCFRVAHAFTSSHLKAEQTAANLNGLNTKSIFLLYLVSKYISSKNIYFFIIFLFSVFLFYLLGLTDRMPFDVDVSMEMGNTKETTSKNSTSLIVGAELSFRQLSDGSGKKIFLYNLPIKLFM